MNQIGNQLYSIEQITGEYLKQPNKTKEPAKKDGQSSFQQVLQTKQTDYVRQQGVFFSKHASERLNSRNIHLTETQLKRLNTGVEQARDKNINESLVMLDNLAFIVNVSNNTVITALDQGGEANHVFTNIDGAVII